MDSTIVTVYVALPMPTIELVEDGDDKSRTTLYDMVDELCELSTKLELPLIDKGLCKVKIELLGDQQRTDLNQWFTHDLLERCEVMSFSCESFLNFDLDIRDANNNNIEVSNENLRDHKKGHVGVMFVKSISDLLVAANLSRAGSIEVLDSCVTQDGLLVNYSKLSNMNAWHLQRAVKLAEQIGWPVLHTIKFEKVWRWVNKNQGLVESFGGTPTSRALNAFSRLFEQQDNDEAMQLLWSMVGIEAIYSKGKVSVMEQIRDKTQALLGKQDAFKKKIGEMYDFRSRFMHGDVDFPGLSFVHDADDRYSKYLNSQYEAVNMATAILTATLQELIIRDWNELDFSYTVHEAK